MKNILTATIALALAGITLTAWTGISGNEVVKTVTYSSRLSYSGQAADIAVTYYADGSADVAKTVRDLQPDDKLHSIIDKNAIGDITKGDGTLRLEDDEIMWVIPFNTDELSAQQFSGKFEIRGDCECRSEGCNVSVTTQDGQPVIMNCGSAPGCDRCTMNITVNGEDIGPNPVLVIRASEVRLK